MKVSLFAKPVSFGMAINKLEKAKEPSSKRAIKLLPTKLERGKGIARFKVIERITINPETAILLFVWSKINI